MHAFHHSLLPPSSVHHSLFLANFTPSTIYPLPQPHTSSPVPDTKVIGNLIVAGGQDLRVFEIREQHVPVAPTSRRANGGVAEGVAEGVNMDEEMAEELGDNFFDTGFKDRAPVRYETSRRLHLLCQHQLHGWITGLAPLRTIESSVDGLDRLLVSFKDAKMAQLEWSRGDIATVSLHTYERCQQMVTGDLGSYIPLLRSDPLSRVAVLTMPEDSLAVLPMLQEQSDLDLVQETFSRDVPYSPSFVLSLSDVSPTIKNLQDLLFLPGFHSPTLAMLYSPQYTWAGRYKSVRDTFCLEIRTFDLSAGGTYPLLTSVSGLPSDSLYIVACPAELGGVVLVTATGIVHIDQSGRTVAAGVNAWWSYATSLIANEDSEDRKLSLEGSKCVFVTGRDMLIVLENGDVHQVRFEMDGRAVGTIKVDEQSSSVPPPSSIVGAGSQAVFVGCAEGDSLLAKVDIIRATAAVPSEKEEVKQDMEVDWDEDLYGDIGGPTANGLSNGNKEMATGPANISLSTYDILSGLGKIVDMEFGIAVDDDGNRTHPQLTAIGGGTKRSTINVLQGSIPVVKRARYNELQNTDAVWFLPIQRQGAQRFKHIPDEERTTMLLSSEGSQTRIFALSAKPTPEQIGRVSGQTLAAASFFHRSSVLLVTATQAILLDSDGKAQQSIDLVVNGLPVVAASISDPYAVVRRADGSVSFLSGDTVARTISEQPGLFADDERLEVAQVFADTTGVYRTFEPRADQSSPGAAGMNGEQDATFTPHKPAQQDRGQRTQEHIRRLQEEKPEISADAPSTETAMNAARGTQWLATLSTQGKFEIRSLPDLAVVLESDGLSTSVTSFTDDLTAASGEADDDRPDEVKQMIFCPVGARSPRPHLLVCHASGRLNIYETQPRFTLDTAAQSRRSLAVRFRKVHTDLLSPSSQSTIPSTVISFSNLEGLTGAFITGDKPQWVVSSDSHPLHTYALKLPVIAFGRTTHTGGEGDYFLKNSEGCSICSIPAGLGTEWTMPCERYEMERTYTNLAFDPTSGLYVGASAISVPFQAYDEEGEIQQGPEGENLIPPKNERSTLELFSTGGKPWRVIDGYDFDQNENVLALQAVVLESSSVPGGYRDFIAVGTGFDFGEDRATRGNTYIFEVVETVPLPGEQRSWCLKIRTKDPARFPVSAIGNINGYLLHSNGPKIYVKGLDYDDRLMGLAFLDVLIYITDIKVFKNFILLSDFEKSIWFVAFQADPYKLTVVSKDLQPIGLVSSDMLVHDGQLAFLTHDREGVTRMLAFDPAAPESINGERLILQTEYNAGAPLATSSMVARRRAAQEEYAPQTQIVEARTDGGISALVSVKPARFKRLQLVSDQLVRNAQHMAGLNPRAFRSVRNDLLLKPLSRGILDGGLLQRFAWQPLTRQSEMLRQIGTDEVTVASDLQALGGFW